MTEVCDSCGSETDERWAVHRMYVEPEAWDAPGKVTVQDDVEHWCFACLTHYPHEPAEA
ncbi:MAG: hypothetical protein IPM45_10310 [Acidimicrobiales bacterium]|nr:hypothetical protein [Acidimicrobiales bacterium]